MSKPRKIESAYDLLTELFSVRSCLHTDPVTDENGEMTFLDERHPDVKHADEHLEAAIRYVVKLRKQEEMGE